MKKLVYTLAVLFSVALVSCGGKKAEAVDSDTVVAAVEEVVVDSAADTTAAAVEAVNGADTTVAVEAVEAPAAQ